MTERFRIHDITLPIAHSMDFDVETMINDFITKSGLSFEVFDANFLVWFEPTEIEVMDDIFARETKFLVTQQITIRRKTESELQQRLESNVSGRNAR